MPIFGHAVSRLWGAELPLALICSLKQFVYLCLWLTVAEEPMQCCTTHPCPCSDAVVSCPVFTLHTAIMLIEVLNGGATREFQ